MGVRDYPEYNLKKNSKTQRYFYFDKVFKEHSLNITSRPVFFYFNRESLEIVFQTHDFTFDTHSVFLETSKTPLPLTSDCFPYGGCTLNIRGRLVVYYIV